MGRRRQRRRGTTNPLVAGLEGFGALVLMTGFGAFGLHQLAWLPLLLVLGLLAGACLVLAVAQAQRRRSRHLRLEQLRQLSPEQFEQWVGARFQERGYRVRHTGQHGDHGIDLDVRSPSEHAIVQCKRYRDRAVGEPSLRDLYGAMHAAGADRAYLVTTSGLTEAAQSWVRGKPIEVWDAQTLAGRGQVSDRR